MNQQDKNKVAKLSAQLDDLLGQAQIIGTELSEMAEAEREKFSNLSEGLQQTEKGQALENAAEQLEAAYYAVDGGELIAAIDALSELEL